MELFAGAEQKNTHLLCQPKMSNAHLAQTFKIALLCIEGGLLNENGCFCLVKNTLFVILFKYL